MAPDDRALLLAWRGGDNRAGQTLVERHRPAVLRSFLNKVGATAEAETLAQRTFATALADRVRLLDGVAVHTWLLAVARHVLLEWRDETARRRRFTGRLDDASVADLGLGPTPAPAPSDGARRMLEALRRLPLETQLVLEHAYIEELAPRELADVLGCLDVVARRHLQVAQPTLRQALGDASPKEIEAWGHQIREAWGDG
jgi:RNA polymerase sigma factor (sigma-70 family)